ncbi:MAG TPA: TolC family protein [Bryobacteraceae bacterium]|nr:TolC family protein [Bryobacteraceae bacterium]
MIRWIGGATICLALLPALPAQPAAPLKLTLKEAVALALKQNPQVILANLEVSDSQQDRLVARSGLLPQVNGNLAETVNRLNLETAIGFAFPGFPHHVGPYYVAQGGVRFNAAVFDLTLWRRFHSAEYGIDSSRAQETAAQDDAILLVESQYLGSQRAAADVQADESRVKLAQALYDQAFDLQKSGVGTGIDTLRANVELQNEKQRLIESSTQLETSLYGLSRLLNVDPRIRIELADQVRFANDQVKLAETPPMPVEQRVELAYGTRPELRQIAADEQRAELALRAAGEERLPKLSLSGFWLEQGLTPSSAIPVYQYQASLDFPIFTGGRIQAQKAEADLAIRQLKQREQDLRNRVALEVKTSTAQMEAARHEIDVANLGVQLAKQEVDQARDRFQAGVANNIEVITAQDELARANDNQIAAYYRYNQARADLAHATGRREDFYVQ